MRIVTSADNGGNFLDVAHVVDSAATVLEHIFIRSRFFVINGNIKRRNDICISVAGSFRKIGTNTHNFTRIFDTQFFVTENGFRIVDFYLFHHRFGNCVGESCRRIQFHFPLFDSQRNIKFRSLFFRQRIGGIIGQFDNGFRILTVFTVCRQKREIQQSCFISFSFGILFFLSRSIIIRLRRCCFFCFGLDRRLLRKSQRARQKENENQKKEFVFHKKTSYCSKSFSSIDLLTTTGSCPLTVTVTVSYPEKLFRILILTISTALSIGSCVLTASDDKSI